MKHLPFVAVAIALTIAPCYAESQGGLFRHAYVCPERGPSSVCVFGTIPRGSQVTLVARDWKSSATPKEEFPNTDSDNGIKTITRLEVAAPPKEAFLIAVLVPADTVNPLPLKEVQDEALVGRISKYVKSTKELKLDPDLQIIKTRLLRLSPTLLLSETFLAPPGEAGDALRKELPTGCNDCENVPLLVGQNLTDLFAETRSTKADVESTCGGIKFAFAQSGRTYLLSYAFSCESDSFSAELLHDLTGKQPRHVRF